MMPRLAVCLLLGVLSLNARWRMPDRCCRLRVTADAGTVGNLPVTVPVDLGQPDPNSIVVTGQRGVVPSRISESLERGEPGRVSWLVERPGKHEYFLYFNRRGGKPAPAVEIREAIGNGDNFFYNRPGGFDPLGVGMKNDQPMAVDWDGDGRTDLLQRNLYSSTYGEPWWGLYFWRNIGTNQEPRFDRYVRLKADGKVIEDYYASFQLTDWNRDRRPDILCGVGASRERNTLKVYLNTGDKDALGLPVLRTGPRVEWHGGGDLTYGMRLADWDGSGVPQLFTLRMKVQYFPTQEMDTTWYRHVPMGANFGPPQALDLVGTSVYEEWPSDFYDVNGDGKPDLVGATRGLQTEPLHSCVVAWENTGSRQAPAFTKRPECIIDSTPEGFAIPVAADSAAFRGLLVSYMGSWLRYFERGPDGFRTRGPLLARGLPCSSGGYSSVDVADWEGDGDLDFIMGNEVGYVQLVENVSRDGGTRFETIRKIPLTNGRDMYAARWQFIRDEDPERPFGQSKPSYVDWDGDGDLDMLVGNNSNRIAYFENVGTRKTPRFHPPKVLTHDGGEHFSFRAHPAVVDWNADGLLDIVTGYTGVRDRNDNPWITVSLYLRYHAADGTLRLHNPEPLRMEDGSELRTPIPFQHGFEAADWDADGDFDLLANQDKVLVLYRNVGSQAQPRFHRELLRVYGQPIRVGVHETSTTAVDWDRDGKLDLITGGESGWVYYFRRSTLESAAAPKCETGIVTCRLTRKPDRRMRRASTAFRGRPSSSGFWNQE